MNRRERNELLKLWWILTDVSRYAEDIVLNEPCGDSRPAIRDAKQALNKIRETLLESLDSEETA